MFRCWGSADEVFVPPVSGAGEAVAEEYRGVVIVSEEFR